MSTDVGSAASAETPELSTIDMALEVVQLPVSDVDRAKRFYQSLGWRFDIDLVVSDDLRTVQFTPPHSQCSIQFGKGRTTAEPGSAQGMILVVERHRRRPGRSHPPRRRRQRGAGGSGPRASTRRRERSYFARASFSDPGRQPLAAPRDHDPAPRPGVGGLTWTSPRWQICCTRRPSVTARSRRPPRPTTGGTGTRRTWTPARAGAAPDEASAAADRYMAEVKHVVVLDEHHRRQPSHNGRGSDAWSRSWTHFSLDRRSPGYCRVTFDHPPINTITATTVAELAELVGLIEDDTDLNVVVFDSANPDFYLAHRLETPRRAASLGPTGLHAWLDLLVRLSRAPVVSIASIRGRARGAGSEFVLACDLRFASRENTLLGQFEVGTGVVPGAARWPGSPAWSVVAGRSRSSSSPTISTDRAPSSTATSTG